MPQKHTHSLLIYTIFFIIVIAYYVMVLHFPLAYIWMTYEDLYGEWMQFYLFAIAMVLSVRIAIRQKYYRRFFLLLGIACFYVIMEEISWGQRIIGFDSPELFKTKNLQGETNLHNFFTGPYNTQLKSVIEYVLAACIILYGAVYPVTLRRRWQVAVWIDNKCRIPPPPLYLWPYFVTAAYLELGLLRFNEAEIAEVLIGFSLMFITIQYFYTPHHKPGSEDEVNRPIAISHRLAVPIGLSTLAVIALAFSTTSMLYAIPNTKEKIDNRIQAGIKKFAGRYTKFQQWETAIGLYERSLEKSPNSRSTLRKLALAHKNNHNTEKFRVYIERALTLDLQRNEENAQRASVHRSLVRTYRLMENNAQADEHLQEALKIGLRRIKEHPDSANAVYSLGRTYALIGHSKKALRQYEMASQLEPGNKKFKKARLRAELKEKNL
ncbi:MAG: tetratricopeptide repeat protein [Gammaproteobacteria bacterium]|nr:tetratricopeptide repeat protein [Gammaproteobacteria bacterium]